MPTFSSHRPRQIHPILAVVLLLGWGLCHFHSPYILSGGDLIHGDRGDTRFCAYILEHEFKSLRGQGDFRSPPMFYPAQGTLGYSELFLGILPPYAAFRDLGADPFSALQLTLILSDLLCFGLTLGLFRRGIGWDLLPSAIGAAFYTFNQARFAQLMHPQMQAGFLIPAVVWAWLEGLRVQGKRASRGWAWFTASGFLAAIQLSTSFYLGWFFLFALGLAKITALCFPATRKPLWDFTLKRKPAWLGSLAGLLVGLVPFLWIYGPILPQLTERHYEDFLSLMPRCRDWLWMGANHPLWGRLSGWFGMDRPDVVEWELRMGWGLVALVALGRGLSLLFRKIKPAKRVVDPLAWGKVAAIASLILAAMVLRWGDFSLWSWVFDWVPGASALRSVGRVSLVLALPAGALLAWLGQRASDKIGSAKKKKRPLLIGLLALAILAFMGEQVSPPPDRGFSDSREMSWLGSLTGQVHKVSAAFYVKPDPDLPATSTELSLDAMWASLESGVPTLNGYSGTEPPGWDLDGLKRPDYQERVDRWVHATGLDHKVGVIRLKK